MCAILLNIANNRNSAANGTDQRKTLKIVGNMPNKQQGIKRHDLPVDDLKYLEFSLGL